MGRKIKSPASGLAHWAYELEMCAGCAVAQEHFEPGSVLRNACLESELVHARGLIEFLIDKPKDDRFSDDMVRTAFAVEWSPKPSDAVDRLRELKPIINKHLAHLSWRRVEDEEAPTWTHRGIAADVLVVAEAWAEHVRSADRILGELALAHVRRAQATLSGE